MTPVPILFIDHADELGGAERSLLLILQHLDRSKWQPYFAGTKGPMLDRVRSLNVRTFPMHMPRLRGASLAVPDRWRAVRGIMRLMRETKATVIYANTVRAALYAAAVRWMSRQPFIWHMRDFWLSESRPGRAWADRLIKRLICASACTVVANSHATAAHLPAGCAPIVIHNAIQVEHFNPALSGAAFRVEHGIPTAAPLAGMIGRLRPWKGQTRFLRVAARLAESLPDVRFLVVGGAIFGVDDDYPDRLRDHCAELGLSARVIFTGHLDDVRPALAAMDVFVHPGEPEPFGLVNLEAMAMARPLVAFAHGALPEIAVHGETGLLVRPVDESALAQAVFVLLQDAPRRQHMGKAARERAEDFFDAARLAAQIDQVLTSALS